MTNISGSVINRKFTVKARGEKAPDSILPGSSVSYPEYANIYGSRTVTDITKMIIILNTIIRYLNFNAITPIIDLYGSYSKTDVSKQPYRNHKIKILLRQRYIMEVGYE